MNIIFILIPLGLVVLAAGVCAFFWAVRTGQFDDLETPAWSVVLDDDTKPPPLNEATQQEQGNENGSSPVD
jgi:cbb3-type cytochrome oxidase maturation protein